LWHRILVALRPEEKSPRVWEALKSLARTGPDLVACFVVMRPTSVAGNELDGNPANEEEVALHRSLRTLLVDHLGPEARGVPIKILHGDPGQRICEYATFARCDLVMLGSRSPRSLGTLLKGSVSRAVAGGFRGSVLLVGD
jgi:nucleotide-binding universal stress UspA family protein